MAHKGKRTQQFFGERKTSPDLLAHFHRVGTMFFENTRRRKLTQLVPDHIFSDKHGIENFSVVHQESMANEIRSYGGATGPSFDRSFGARATLLVNLLQQMLLDKRAFF